MKSIPSHHLLKGAVITGILNALINGIINWFQVRQQDSILITADAISNREHTVMGSAVMLALMLSVIIASIAWFTMKDPVKPKFFPGVFLLILKNALFLFGTFVTVAILWQRYAGSVEVTPITAAILTGVFAGIVAGMTDYLTRKELLTKTSKQV